ncbi:hypothetical protein B9Z55_015228 [Caenorhabditis nigoni]|uniref:Uncharacterized protein n=1 Tax=Caenorhabditis nigoni TaxID=1611254 RepID=A0A2G5U991_9PELO|nr:hypothetical protein B9Z55_015228 [Caenorhabditis nigoni]
MSAVNRHILSKAIAEMSASNNNSVRLYDPQDTSPSITLSSGKVQSSFRLTFTYNGPLAQGHVRFRPLQNGAGFATRSAYMETQPASQQHPDGTG